MTGPGSRSPAPVLLHPRTMRLLALLTLARAAAAQFPRHQSSSCALMMPSYSHQTCISYEDVNAAFHEARNKFGLPPVEKKFGIADVNVVVHVSKYYFQIDDSRLAIWEELCTKLPVTSPNNTRYPRMLSRR